ncbi:hypothetical protein [Pseudoflavonifractor sp. MSJ-37]|uniref:hypothetical protein n=1 Tax=Pseudoflavonifractor sp. MSJ-37 TaxID=2841531 RepID=UPI001C115D9E|nr:hypothetical protein [Pseudoflavonifractor sp. MSJ-37]MBU5435910.1 hypothetical protein [Pseudoflavonifractor sp. MSJ-37]
MSNDLSSTAVGRQTWEPENACMSARVLYDDIIHRTSMYGARLFCAFGRIFMKKIKLCNNRFCGLLVHSVSEFGKLWKQFAFSYTSEHIRFLLNLTHKTVSFIDAYGFFKFFEKGHTADIVVSCVAFLLVPLEDVTQK